MFDYKSIITNEIEWFNPAYVVRAYRKDGYLIVTLTDGSLVWLADNWKDRNDIKRYEKYLDKGVI